MCDVRITLVGHAETGRSSSEYGIEFEILFPERHSSPRGTILRYYCIFPLSFSYEFSNKRYHFLLRRLTLDLRLNIPAIAEVRWSILGNSPHTSSNITSLHYIYDSFHNCFYGVLDPKLNGSFFKLVSYQIPYSPSEGYCVILAISHDTRLLRFAILLKIGIACNCFFLQVICVRNGYRP